MSENEFQTFINQLIRAELIEKRTVDEIDYYDSTLKTEEYKNKNYREIRKFVIDSFRALTSAIAEGATAAIVAA